MKKTLFLLLALTILFAAGCETAQEQNSGYKAPVMPKYTPEAEQRARQVAMDYVMGMKLYNGENGRNLTVIRASQYKCIGCWYVDLQYDLNSATGSGTDRMTLNLSLSEWKVVEGVSDRTRLG